MKTRKEQLEKKLAGLHAMYDGAERLIGERRKEMLAGYHSKITGMVHGTNISAEYAAAVFYAGQKEYYGRAEDIFIRLCGLQDTREGSATFGLWPYYAEESLEKMEAPDYNFADFIGKHFIYALEEHASELSKKTADMMRTAVRNAVRCSIKRNVSPDYSNISMMSCMTIISAGELLGDDDITVNGKARLKKAYEYNTCCGAFSEYNSSTYTPLAIAELTRMLMYFKDEECRRIASELNDMAWENLSLYYSRTIGELAPPQKRCYRDLDNGELAAFLYFATGGRAGSCGGAEELGLPYLMLPIKCPERMLGNFERTGPRFMKKRYYKKNSIRTPDEDTVIVRNIDSPDLYAYTYMDDDFAAGAFDKSDLWYQRRTCSAVWNSGGTHRGFRLRCINGGHDFCSGVVSAAMDGPAVIGCAGFVNDHGSRHYILDKEKAARFETDRLEFVFELCGDTDGVDVTDKGGGVYVISDGNITVTLTVGDWVFDGKKAPVVFDREKKTITLEAYKGEKKLIDLCSAGECFGAFAFAVNGRCPVPAVKKDGIICRVYDEENEDFGVYAPASVTGFDEFMSIGKE